MNRPPEAAQTPPPAGLAPDDWAATPPAVRAAFLALVAQVATLEQRLADLEELLNRNSRNSSQPPSADGPHVKARPAQPPTGRPSGAQAGHAGHGRKLQPPHQVDRVIEVKPECCGQCGCLLLGEDPQAVRHQVSELPRVAPLVTEYRRHTLRCLSCGARTQAPWPAAMPAGSFGPRLQAAVGYLSGRLGASQRDSEEVLHTVFHSAISLGSIGALEQQVSAALEQPVAAATAHVQAQAAVNVDETGWRQAGQRAWLWIAATPRVTVFEIAATRGAKGLVSLLGEEFLAGGGLVGSDRWSAYNGLAVSRRQLCWAHLARDFQALVERGGESARLGHALLEQERLTFGLWQQVQAGTLGRPDFALAMQPVQAAVGALLREGTQVHHEKTRRTCANLLKLEAALWSFVRVVGVEPTNNAAERPLRRAVLWRRRSFGTQSHAGSEFVARVLTVVSTLRQQKRDVLDFLTQACTAALSGGEPPSLLPCAAVGFG
jgi:transposase